MQWTPDLEFINDSESLRIFKEGINGIYKMSRGK